MFIASGDSGATTSSEIYLLERSGKLYGRKTFESRKPADSFVSPSNWTFQEILYKIGMPVRTDKSKSYSAIKTNWKAKTSLNSGDIGSIPNSALDDWKNLSERRLPDEQDTALGITINDYNSVIHDGNFNIIYFNPKRMTRDKLDVFLAPLKDTSGNTIGNRFVKTGNTPGKDFDLIVFVSSAPYGRAQNITGGFFTLIREDMDWIEMAGTINDFRHILNVDNGSITDMPISEKGTLTHELGHSFALEDEYGENPPVNGWKNKFINDPAVTNWEWTAFSGPASLADWSSNTQHKQDLLSPNPNVPGTGIIDATKIKWRFHRIKKCGVLFGQPCSKRGKLYNHVKKRRSKPVYCRR